MKRLWITYIATMVMVFIITFVISLLTEGRENQEQIVIAGTILLALGCIVALSTVKGAFGKLTIILAIILVITAPATALLSMATVFVYSAASMTTVAGVGLASALDFLEEETIHTKTMICLIIAVLMNSAIIYFTPIIF